MLKARDQEIAEGRLEREALNARNSEVETSLCKVLVDLTDTEEAKDSLATELSSSRASRVTLAEELNTAKAEKEQVVAEQKGVESRYKRLRKKYHHYKAKAKRYFKQLTLVPWLRDLGWSRGFNWAFEN